MDFMGRLQKSLAQGIGASRELYGKAKVKAKDLGEKGLLHFEIAQLEKQAEGLVGQLGARVFETLSKNESAVVDRATPGISELLNEIKRVNGEIEEKEANLRRLG